ncbi:hypothetical protein D3C85_1227170 [compost metagenome]
MHLLDHPAPAGERALSVQVRQVAFANAGFAEGSGMIDTRGFGDDQAGFTFSAPPVITGDVFAGHPFGAEIACHGGHDNTVF